MSSQRDNNPPRDLIHPINTSSTNTNPSPRAIRSVSESDAPSAASQTAADASAAESPSATTTPGTPSQSPSTHTATTFRPRSVRSQSSIAHRRNRTGPATLYLYSGQSNFENLANAQPAGVSSNNESFASIQRRRHRPPALPFQYVPNVQGIALAKRLGIGSGRSQRGSLSGGEGSGSGSVAVFSAGSSQASAQPVDTEESVLTMGEEKDADAGEESAVAMGKENANKPSEKSSVAMGKEKADMAAEKSSVIRGKEMADASAHSEKSVGAPVDPKDRDEAQAGVSLKKEKEKVNAADTDLFDNLDEDAVLSNDPEIGPSAQRPTAKHTRDMTETSELLSLYQNRFSLQSPIRFDFPDPVSKRSFNSKDKDAATDLARKGIIQRIRKAGESRARRASDRAKDEEEQAQRGRSRGPDETIISPTFLPRTPTTARLAEWERIALATPTGNGGVVDDGKEVMHVFIEPELQAEIDEQRRRAAAATGTQGSHTRASTAASSAVVRETELDDPFTSDIDASGPVLDADFEEPVVPRHEPVIPRKPVMPQAAQPTKATQLSGQATRNTTVGNDRASLLGKQSVGALFNFEAAPTRSKSPEPRTFDQLLHPFQENQKRNVSSSSDGASSDSGVSVIPDDFPMPNVPIAGGDRSVSGFLRSEATVHLDEKAVKNDGRKGFDNEEEDSSPDIITKNIENAARGRETSSNGRDEEPIKIRSAADNAGTMPTAFLRSSYVIWPSRFPEASIRTATEKKPWKVTVAENKRTKLKPAHDAYEGASYDSVDHSSEESEAEGGKKPRKERVPLVLGSPRPKPLPLPPSAADTYFRENEAYESVNKDIVDTSGDENDDDAAVTAELTPTVPAPLFSDKTATTPKVAPVKYGFFPEEWQSPPKNEKTIYSRRKNEDIKPLRLQKSSHDTVPDVKPIVPAPLFADSKVNAPKHPCNPSFKPEKQEPFGGAKAKGNQQRFYKTYPVVGKQGGFSIEGDSDEQTARPPTPQTVVRQPQNFVAPIPLRPLPAARRSTYHNQAHSRNPSTSSTSYTPHPAYQNTTIDPDSDPFAPLLAAERERNRSRTIPLRANTGAGLQINKTRRNNTDADTGVGAWWNFKIGGTSASNISAHVRDFSGSAGKKIVDRAVSWGVGKWAGQAQAGSPAPRAGADHAGDGEEAQSSMTAGHGGGAHGRDMSAPTGVTGSAERAGAAGNFTTVGGMSPGASVAPVAKPEAQKAGKDELVYPLGRWEEDWKDGDRRSPDHGNSKDKGEKTEDLVDVVID
ncbi:MAG: hypothetical protein M1831_002391 [Alyxoria varia]|nr:MAG: hypothetical protein M1831_002391 [Alyxoria varia]